MTLDERLQALTMNLELVSMDIQSLLQVVTLHSKQLDQDGEHIRALARIAETQNERLIRIEER